MSYAVEKEVSVDSWAMSRRKFLKKSAIAGGAVTLEGLAPVRMANPQAASAQTPAVTPSNDKVKLSSPTDGEVLQTA